MGNTLDTPSAAAYKQAFLAYLKQALAAQTHNQKVIDDFKALIQPVTVQQLLLSTGVTVVTTGSDDLEYWTVVENDKLRRWRYFNLAGISEKYEVKPGGYTEPFFEHYMIFHGYGVQGNLSLVAGTNTQAVKELLVSKMLAMPDEPERPEELDQIDADNIEREVRRELDPAYDSVPY